MLNFCKRLFLKNKWTGLQHVLCLTRDSSAGAFVESFCETFNNSFLRKRLRPTLPTPLTPFLWPTSQTAKLQTTPPMPPTPKFYGSTLPTPSCQNLTHATCTPTHPCTHATHVTHEPTPSTRLSRLMGK